MVTKVASVFKSCLPFYMPGRWHPKAVCPCHWDACSRSATKQGPEWVRKELFMFPTVKELWREGTCLDLEAETQETSID